MGDRLTSPLVAPVTWESTADCSAWAKRSGDEPDDAAWGHPVRSIRGKKGVMRERERWIAQPLLLLAQEEGKEIRTCDVSSGPLGEIGGREATRSSRQGFAIGAYSSAPQSAALASC